MPTKTLSPPQTRFLAATRAAGDKGFPSPPTSNRRDVTLASAWHRTADSLETRGLIRTAHNGSMRRAWIRE